jgi:RimJ/RimL family protein N-acetyltransferase
MFFIESTRLRLIPLTHQLLQIGQTSRVAMELAMGLNPSSMQIDELYQNEIADAMTHFWLPKTLEHSDLYQWYTSWEFVLKATNTAIGGIGFTGYPNADGETGIGYMLDSKEHGKGYATESLNRLIEWAFMHDDVKCIVVHTYEDNMPSRKLLLRCSFIEIGKDAENLYTYKLKKP